MESSRDGKGIPMASQGIDKPTVQPTVGYRASSDTMLRLSWVFETRFQSRGFIAEWNAAGFAVRYRGNGRRVNGLETSVSGNGPGSVFRMT